MKDDSSAIVVDASVGIKWFLEEIYTKEAERLIDNDSICLHVPDLFFAEIGNILWKRCRANLLVPDNAREIISKLSQFPLKVWPIKSLTYPAFEIAASADRTLYDSLYLALAIRLKTSVITADKKLFNSLQNTPLAKHIGWIEGET